MFGVWPSLKRVGSLTCWNRKQSLIPSRNTDDMCSHGGVIHFSETRCIFQKSRKRGSTVDLPITVFSFQQKFENLFSN